MKLRVKGNSLRLRLTRPEVQQLRDSGLVGESINFAQGGTLIYRVQAVEVTGPVRAEFQQGIISVIIPAETARAWADSKEVGIYAQCGALRISIERDFKCLTHASEEEKADAYPNPDEPPAADDGGTVCRP